MATTDRIDPTQPLGITPASAPDTAPATAPAPAPAPAGSPTPAAPPSRRRRRRALAAWLGAVLVLGAAGGVLVARSTDDTAATEADPTKLAVDATDPGGEPTGEATDASVPVPTTVGSVPDPVPDPEPVPDPVPGPVVTSITAPATFGCAPDAPGQPMNTQLTLHWSTKGAQSVAVAIDDPDGVFASGLPATGSLVVPAPCAPDSNTYHVIATAPDGRTTTASTTTTGRP